MADEKDVLDGLISELKRGTLVLGVLSQLREPHYGYTLVKNLADQEMPIDKNTLYPLLRRLEKQELLKSEWDTEGSRPRRYYQLSDYGTQVYEDLKNEWFSLNKILEHLLGESEEKEKKE